MRSWPLQVLAALAAEVWSGWVGIAQKTGFGLVCPLLGILPSEQLMPHLACRAGLLRSAGIPR